MTLQDFITKYNGKYLDFDGYYGAQCVDALQFYAKEVVGAPAFTGNAKDIPNTYDKNFYTWIPNSISAVPQSGDIIIWGSSVGGGYGHIAVCQSANILSFTSFEQNWPLNTPCHSQTHNDLYKGVLGWLRPKKPVQPVTVSDRQCLEEIARLVNPATSPVGGDLIGKWRVKAVLAKVGL